MTIATEIASIAGGSVLEGVEGVATAVGNAVNEKAVLATDLAKTELQSQTQVIQADVADRTSARSMQSSALTQDDKFSKRFIYYFSIFWSLAGALYIGFITFSTIPPENVRFADTILGFMLGTAISGMFQFFYGSTQNSHKKDETIATMAKPWIDPDKQ